MANNNLPPALQAKIRAKLIAKCEKIIQKDLAMLEAITKKHFSRGVLGGATPVVYNQTGQLVSSIYKTDLIVSGNKITAMVTFDGSAWHDSYIGGNRGYTPLLVSDGWHWRSRAGRPRIPNFTDFNGTRAIDLIVSEFNSRKSKYTNLKVIGR